MNLFGKKQVDIIKNVVRSFSDHFAGWFTYGNAAAPPLDIETALENATVLACVKLIAEGVASCPVSLKEKSYNGNKVITKTRHDHWAHKLLAVKPNETDTPISFIETMIINSVLGKGSLAIKKTIGKRVVSLQPIPSGAWVGGINGNGDLTYTVTFTSGAVTYPASECLFLHNLGYDGYSGISAMDKLRKAVGVSTSLEDFQLRLASNGGNPSGIISFEETLEEGSADALRENYKSKWGAGGEGGIAVLDGGAKFVPISQTAADAQIIETRKFQIQEICAVFGVDPRMIGHGNKDEKVVQNHNKTCIMPWIKRFEAALNKDILNNDPNLYFDFDDKDLMRGDPSSQLSAYRQALGSGGTPAIMSVNEIRFEMGLDPIPEAWADEVSKGGYELSAKPAKTEEDK